MRHQEIDAVDALAIAKDTDTYRCPDHAEFAIKVIVLSTFDAYGNFEHTLKWVLISPHIRAQANAVAAATAGNATDNNLPRNQISWGWIRDTICLSIYRSGLTLTVAEKLLASRIAVEVRTVRFHLSKAFRKLHVEIRTSRSTRTLPLIGPTGGDRQ